MSYIEYGLMAQWVKNLKLNCLGMCSNLQQHIKLGTEQRDCRPSIPTVKQKVKKRHRWNLEGRLFYWM